MAFTRLLAATSTNLAVALMAAVSPMASAQVEVGNGGDVIYCREDAGESEFSGWYFLDYVATWDSVLGRDAFHTSSDPVEHIISLLMDRMPSLGMSLREFVDEARRQLAQGSDPTRRFIWMRTSNGILALRDEQLSFLPESFPANCFEPNSTGGRQALNLHQVVIHQNRGEASIFKYDPQYATRIVNDPIQASMLFVHEWLWRYSPNATVTRDVNRYLHTQAVERTDGQSLKRALTNLGLDLSSLPAPRVELRFESTDPDFEGRSYPLDPDYGVDLLLTNVAEGFFIVEIEPDQGIGTTRIFMRPRALGGPTEVLQHLPGGATVYVAVCRNESCATRQRVLDIRPR